MVIRNLLRRIDGNRGMVSLVKNNTPVTVHDSDFDEKKKKLIKGKSALLRF